MCFFMCLPPKIEATHFAAATLAWITHSTHLAFSPVESEPDVPDDGRDVGHPQSDRLLLSALLSGRGSLHSDHTCHAPRLPLPHWVYTLLEERSTSLASKRKQFDFLLFSRVFCRITCKGSVHIRTEKFRIQTTRWSRFGRQLRNSV